MKELNELPKYYIVNTKTFTNSFNEATFKSVEEARAYGSGSLASRILLVYPLIWERKKGYGGKMVNDYSFDYDRKFYIIK